MINVNMDIGAPPRFEMVDVSLVDIDSNYQRELDAGKVEKMLADFRWDHYGAVVLAAHDNGRYTCTDGQHRVKAAQLHPAIERVPAMIIAVSGTQAEAENFLVINRDRKAVSPIEKYWAGLTAGDIQARRIRDVLLSAGCDVAPDAGTYKPHLTNAVGALGRALQRYGDKAVRLSVETIRNTWPREAKALRGTLITSLARLIEYNENIDFGRLKAVLAPKSFAEMTAHAEAFRKLSGGSAETALCRAIVELYNRGRSANTILIGAEK